MFAVSKCLFLSFIALTPYADRQRSCPILPGAEELWRFPAVRFVIVGEMHGTNEAPVAFADLICSAPQARRPIIVGLEFADQQTLNKFFRTAARRQRVRQLLSTDEWKLHDGRTSTAMLELLERLRILKSEGVVSEIVAFAAMSRGDGPGGGEKQMASVLFKAAERDSDALVVVLTGNLHAFKKDDPGLATYSLMASFLPATRTLSLAITGRGGQAWNCQDGTCGPHTIDSSGGANRGISLESPHPAFDGVLSTGLPATASMPADRS